MTESDYCGEYSQSHSGYPGPCEMGGVKYASVMTLLHFRSRMNRWMSKRHCPDGDVCKCGWPRVSAHEVVNYIRAQLRRRSKSALTVAGGRQVGHPTISTSVIVWT